MALRLALVQMRPTGDAQANLEQAKRAIATAAEQGADMVCLPELFLGPYFPQEEDHAAFDLAEPIPGPTTEALAAAAKEHSVVVVGSIFERRGKGVYHNTAVVLDADGSLVGKYRKMHIPDDPRFYEKFYFAPGDLGVQVFDTAAGRIAPLVCWDQWFPEAARLAALQGADLILYPTAIGTWHGEKEYTQVQQDAWQTVQRGHAIANGCFVAAVNRVGTEGELDFWGHSFVAGPDGAVRFEADDQPGVRVVRLDLDEVEQSRRGWPFLRDRRIDSYGDLAKRFVDG